ncbi:MAG: glycosyltransferase family 4 protein, partial [Thiotrichaceae bacterium]|nr:glycosyltransferase family 4 protein [Thiotrichaceae bacterium]
GVETYAYEYCKALLKKGYEVSVFTTVNRNSVVYNEEFQVFSVLTARYEHDRVVLLGYTVDAWHSMNAGYSWLSLETDTPVVVSVHGNDFLRPYAPYSKIGSLDLYKIGFLWRFKKQLEVLENFIRQRRINSLIKKGLSNASIILTNSHYTENALIDKFPSCKGKTSVALCGLGEDFVQIKHIQHNADEPLRLITVSRLSERRKNIDIALKALAKIKVRYQFTYTIIGDGYIRSELEELTKTLNLTSQVSFEGFVEKEKLIESLATSDLFILPSSILPASHEGFGIVYIESAACGTPVLAARLAGAIEAVKENVSGLFVNEPNVQEIENALVDFFEQKVTFTPTSCQDFARGFTWEKVVSHALPYYE